MKHTSLEELDSWLMERVLAEGGPMFMGKPDRWWEVPHWRCIEGHVSRTYLKTERGGKCLACDNFVKLTFPEDTEEPHD